MSNNNELKDGPWINYYFNGQLAEKGNYKDGKREGPCSSYFCVNGQLIYEGNYKDGKEEGPYSSYYYNGQSSLVSIKMGRWRNLILAQFNSF